jgi:hypothetical protein
VAGAELLLLRLARTNYWVDISATIDAKIEAFCFSRPQFGRRVTPTN